MTSIKNKNGIKSSKVSFSNLRSNYFILKFFKKLFLISVINITILSMKMDKGKLISNVTQIFNFE